MPTAFGYESNAMNKEGSGVSIKTYKPAISLLVITLVAGLALGAAYEMLMYLFVRTRQISRNLMIWRQKQRN